MCLAINLNMLNKTAYIALNTILIVSAIILLISIGANLAGISESNMGLIKYQSSQSYYLAQACAEYTLKELSDGAGYAGNETLNIDGGSCYIYPPEGTGNQNRIVKVSGTLDNLTRKLKINISRINPEMEIISWEEVTSF